MDGMIWITTSKHSTLFRRIFAAYHSGVEVRIDGRSYGEGDLGELSSRWCTNRAIRGTRDFTLLRGGKELFSFHDGPTHLWAAHSELRFVRELREDRIVRYRVTPVPASQPGRFRSVVRKVAHAVWGWLGRSGARHGR
jgi:hypothetical protein